MVDGEHDARGAGVGTLGARAAVLDDPDVPVRRRVVDVEEAARRVVGGEGERQQAALAARVDPAGDVEERPLDLLAAADDPHGAALLDDEDAPPVAGRRSHVHGAVERPDAAAGAGPDGRSSPPASRSPWPWPWARRARGGAVPAAATAEREHRRRRYEQAYSPHHFKNDRRGARARRSPAPRLSCSLLPAPAAVREPQRWEIRELAANKFAVRSAAHETLEEVIELSRRIARQAGVHRRRLHDRARRCSQPVEALGRIEAGDRPAVRRRRPPRAPASRAGRARRPARSRAPGRSARPRRAPSSRRGTRAGG